MSTHACVWVGGEGEVTPGVCQRRAWRKACGSRSLEVHWISCIPLGRQSHGACACAAPTAALGRRVSKENARLLQFRPPPLPASRANLSAHLVAQRAPVVIARDLAAGRRAVAAAPCTAPRVGARVGAKSLSALATRAPQARRRRAMRGWGARGGGSATEGPTRAPHARLCARCAQGEGEGTRATRTVRERRRNKVWPVARLLPRRVYTAARGRLKGRKRGHGRRSERRRRRSTQQRPLPPPDHPVPLGAPLSSSLGEGCAARRARGHAQRRTAQADRGLQCSGSLPLARSRRRARVAHAASRNMQMRR